MNNYIYGLDFGTSNSALSILDIRTKEVVHTFIEASVLYFPQPLTSRDPVIHFVGKEAVKKYVASAQEGRLMKSLKSVLPRTSFTHTYIYRQKYTAEELVALIISHLKKLADDWTGEEVTTVVLGRPVVFDEKRANDQLAQDRIRKAAQIAGFRDYFFQLEPIAAAFTYERHLQKAEKVLVADLGGGTSDFTVMQLDPNRAHSPHRKQDMLAKGGIHIGGDDFDSEIMWKHLVAYFGYGLQYKSYDKMLDLPLHYFRNICSWEEMNFFKNKKIKSDLEYYYFATGNNEAIARLMTLVGDNWGYALFRAIEQGKIDLSDQDVAEICFQAGNIDIQEEITIAAFSNTIQKDTQKIGNYLDQFLADTGLTYTDIDTVFMTGGSSLVRPIRKMIEERFGADAMQSGDNFNSVANGLAYCSVLFGEVS